jgi:4-amino-4-deoxy-L-arabinose transferase-like glycosyltransferase
MATDLWGKGILTHADKRPLTILFFLCFIAWLPGFFTLPPLDRDESRFAQATKQMLETGDYIDIRYGEGVRYKKPAGIHWLQAASTAVFGEGARNQIWTYRLPSLIGAFAAVALAFWVVRAFAGVEAAFLAALLLGMTVLLAAESKISKTDAVLLATVLGTQGVMLRAYLSARIPGRPPPSLALALAGWTAFAIGVLIKGPIILAVCLAGFVAIAWWDRDARWFMRLKPLWGVLLMLAIVLPWGIAIGLESHGLFYEKALGEDFAKKIVGGEETHGAPPGYYLALVSFSFWPATLLLIPGIVAGIKRRAEPAIRYLVAWAGGAWLMFEVVPTKLPHYILPAYPALIFLAVLWLLGEGREIESKWERVARYVSIALFAAVGVLYALLAAFAPNHLGYGSTWWLHAGAALGAAGVITAAVFAIKRERLKATFAAILAALILYPLTAMGTAPRLQQIWLSPRLYEAALRDARPNDPPAILSGYTEPSLVFLLGTKTRIAGGQKAAEIASVQGGLALIESKQQAPFLNALRAHDATVQAVEEIDGINYSRGHAAHVTVYRVTLNAHP